MVILAGGRLVAVSIPPLPWLPTDLACPAIAGPSLVMPIPVSERRPAW
jgi:hypothetical protein